MIKAILFDYDGTLSNRMKSAYNKYKADCKEIFPELDPNGVEFDAIVQRCLNWDEFGTITKSHVYENLNRVYKVNVDVGKYMDKWVKEFPLYQVLQKDCKEIVEKLGKKYRLGVITNGSSYSQHAKLENTGLKKYFECVFVSGDYGIHKPNKEIFLMAAKEMNLKPEEIAFIGDTYATDILGAHRAGMYPVWFFNDPLRVSDADIKRIHHFDELLEIFDVE